MDIFNLKYTDLPKIIFQSRKLGNILSLKENKSLYYIIQHF